MAADAGQIRHAHEFLIAFINQGETFPMLGIIREMQAYFVKKALIDFVDDLQMSWQQLTKKR